MNICMNKYGVHNPDYLIEISREEYTCITSDVVRWCTICGAIVIDTDYDGRIKPGDVMKMRFPTNEQSEL